MRFLRSVRMCALIVAGSALTTADAHAQLSLGLGGGATWPVSTLSKSYSTGYNILTFLGLGNTESPINIRFDGMYNQSGHASSAPQLANLQILTLNANVVVNIGAKKGKSVTPYVIGGVGYYNDSYNISVFGDSVAATGNIHANSLGVNAGAGLHFGNPSIGAFIEARYHYIWHGDHGLEFVPLTAGITIF